MNKEVYELREILLGLRKVYQQNKQDLEDLKQYIQIC